VEPVVLHSVINHCKQAICDTFEVPYEGDNCNSGETPKGLWERLSNDLKAKPLTNNDPNKNPLLLDIVAKEDQDGNPPDVVIKVTDFFYNREAASPHTDYYVFGLTVLDLHSKEFWKHIMCRETRKDDDKYLSAQTQLKAMGGVVDTFLNETGFYPDVMKQYYKLDLGTQEEATNDSSE
jgi:hypothetical protein